MEAPQHKRGSAAQPPPSALQAALRDGARPATATPYLGSPPRRHGSPRAQMAHGRDADSRGDAGRRLSSPSTFQCRFGASPTSSKWLRVPARAEQCERGTERRAAGSGWAGARTLLLLLRALRGERKEPAAGSGLSSEPLFTVQPPAAHGAAGICRRREGEAAAERPRGTRPCLARLALLRAWHQCCVPQLQGMPGCRLSCLHSISRGDAGFREASDRKKIHLLLLKGRRARCFLQWQPNTTQSLRTQ